jgi:hypothetical protein
MKQKVIDVKYRKDSTKFPEWMKYEVTLLNEDGSTEIIPAYGKDLQDALARVVHDNKIDKIEPKIKNIPAIIWAMIWFGYVIALSIYSFTLPEGWNASVFLLGIASITLTVGYISFWFKKRNVDKNG